MSDKNNFRPKITYVNKKPSVCPVCGNKFYKEILLTGGGRLNAGQVTDTLHRVFIPSQKFGIIHPLIYMITVCPDCFFACMPADFESALLERSTELQELKQDRIDFVTKLIGVPVDFTKAMTLESGAAAYALAVLCYDFFSRKNIPVIKQAICSIRTAFLFEDLEKEKPNKYYRFISELFYKKALFFYQRAIELNQSKQQVMETMKTYGPDVDRDYGYDGVLYLIGILKLKFGNRTEKERRINELNEAKSYLGKLFGFGKSDFDKPKEILDKSKDFYDVITKEIARLNE